MDEIRNRNGKLSTVTGKGVLAFRLKALYLALKFRRDVGQDMDRRFNSIKIAKQETGLKTRDIEKLMTAVMEKMNAVIAECTVVNECEHDWQEQPGEPPVDTCFRCGAIRE